MNKYIDTECWNCGNVVQLQEDEAPFCNAACEEEYELTKGTESDVHDEETYGAPPQKHGVNLAINDGDVPMRGDDV